MQVLLYNLLNSLFFTIQANEDESRGYLICEYTIL